MAVVNHIWVEDCFRTWERQAVTKPQYTHFPTGVSLDFLVGLAPYLHEDLDGRQQQEPGDQIVLSQISDSEASRDFPSASTSDLGQSRAPRKAANSATQALARLMEAQNQYEQISKNKLKKLSAPSLALDSVIEANAILPLKPEPKRHLTPIPPPETESTPVTKAREAETTPRAKQNRVVDTSPAKKKAREAETLPRAKETRGVETTPAKKKAREAETLPRAKKTRGVETTPVPRRPRRAEATASEAQDVSPPLATAVPEVRILFTGHKPTKEETKVLPLPWC